MDAKNEANLELIIDAYVDFLAVGEPPIHDAGLLPYPKQVILAALRWKEGKLCHQANHLSVEQRDIELEPVSKHLRQIQTILGGLFHYAAIEDADKERVQYFNETYKTLADVAKGSEHELTECLAYHFKYSSLELE